MKLVINKNSELLWSVALSHLYKKETYAETSETILKIC